MADQAVSATAVLIFKPDNLFRFPQSIPVTT
jgi:hypothetical protein